MRYMTIRTIPAEGKALHPIGEELAEEPAVTRSKLHKVEVLDEKRGVMLSEERGDLDRYREALDRCEYVYEYTVVENEGWWYSYIIFEPTDVTHQLMETRYETEIMIQMPIEIEADGSMVGTLVGPEESFGQLPRADSDAFDLEVVETGTYHPDLDDLYLSLTERQREVLDVAVEVGYYENPRGATHRDIADAVDASPGTVGEHLRKIESRVFDQLVG